MSIQRISHCFSVAEMFPVWLGQLAARSNHIPGRPGALAGDMTIEALPTWYADTTFRSALEAGWAATLDSLSIRWQYEPETIALPSGANYLPDFWLPEIGTWLEVKGTGVPRIEKAVELGESRACRCDKKCTCDWPDGELVLIGHPPAPYDASADPRLEGAPYRIRRRFERRHGGHPLWSNAHGRPAWLTRCLDCQRASWFTSPRCRACRGRLAGAHAYGPGDTDLEFVKFDCRPAPDDDPESEAA